MNASFVDKMGYGRYFENLSSDYLKAFLYDLPVFKSNLACYSQNGNETLFNVLDSEIKKHL